MIKATQTHHGQYRPYGDSHDVWMVEADEEMGYEEVLAWCRENLIGGSTVPEKREFDYRHRNDYTFTWNDYFKGYVELYRYTPTSWNSASERTVMDRAASVSSGREAIFICLEKGVPACLPSGVAPSRFPMAI